MDHREILEWNSHRGIQGLPWMEKSVSEFRRPTILTGHATHYFRLRSSFPYIVYPISIQRKREFPWIGALRISRNYRLSGSAKLDLSTRICSPLIPSLFINWTNFHRLGGGDSKHSTDRPAWKCGFQLDKNDIMGSILLRPFESILFAQED